MDAANNRLTQVLGNPDLRARLLSCSKWTILILIATFVLADFDTPKCTHSNAWVNGGKWIGSLLRRANLCRNRIEGVRDLTESHPFLQELYLAHNGITAIAGVSQLRFLRVLDLSHNKLTSTRGLVAAAAERAATDEKNLEALEKLVLSHNQISSVDEVASLPRLEHLDVAHNNMKQLSSIGVRGTPVSLGARLCHESEANIRVCCLLAFCVAELSSLATA